jgi:hypothetical protein
MEDRLVHTENRRIAAIDGRRRCVLWEPIVLLYRLSPITLLSGNTISNGTFRVRLSDGYSRAWTTGTFTKLMLSSEQRRLFIIQHFLKKKQVVLIKISDVP